MTLEVNTNGPMLTHRAAEQKGDQICDLHDLGKPQM